MVISDFWKFVLIFAAAILLLGLITAGWVVARGTKPMQIAEAGGMTFWEFIGNRMQAQKVANITRPQIPQQSRCKNRVLRVFTGKFFNAIRYAWDCVQAGKDDGENVVHADGNLLSVAPTTIGGAPEKAWGYFEAAAWQALAVEATTASECALSPINAEQMLIAVTGGGENTAPAVNVQAPAPTLTPMAEEIPPRTKIATGAQVTVEGTEGLGLRVREEPGLFGSIQFKGQEGELFSVIDGPFFVDNIAWWKIRSEAHGEAGWAAEDYLIVQE